MSTLDGIHPAPAPNLGQKERFEHFQNVNISMRALLALDAGRMGSWSLNIVTGEVVGDRLVAKLLGLNYDSQPWDVSDFYDTVDSEDLSGVQSAVENALSGTERFYDIEFKSKRQSAHEPVKWLGARGQVTERNENGEPLRLIGVNWDATEKKLLEEKHAMLAAEMDHRVKNAFAVIQALINLGDRLTNDKEEFATSLRTQVQAMSAAHAMSARMARTSADVETSVSVREIIETALAPWLSDRTHSKDRVQITCDPEILIHPRKVSPLAMLLYEISTNATKFGALSADVGLVKVDVAQVSDGDVQITWVETQQTPHQAPKSNSGFGSILLENCAVNLGGSVTQDMQPDGLHITLVMDVSG